MTIDDTTTIDGRMRRLSMITAVVAIAPLSVLGVALTATSWWEGATMALGYVLALGILREWNLERYPRPALFALMLTAAGWIIGALSAASPISFVPLSLVGALLLARTVHRLRWILAFALGVAAIGAGAFLFHPPTWRLAALYLAAPILGTVLIAAVILASEQAWLIALRLERAKETEAELAVARERVRFVGDLHDLHGHSLHVIKLKAALAGRLVRADPARAEIELGEIRRLADEGITQTRELAYAGYELNLPAELENATRVIEAAGIAVTTRLDLGTEVTPHPLLAQVLREATTNLLRHAHPTSVSISASAREVTVDNDGAAEDDVPQLRGLARLRSRIEAGGGSLRIDRPVGRFRVSARIDPSSVTEETRRVR